MFTGLVEESGTIVKSMPGRGGVTFRIRGSAVTKRLTIGASIAVDGTCLTVIRRGRRTFDVQAVEETLFKTSLGKKKEGDEVNLERPLRADERLGGHFVLGHVDCTTKVTRVTKRKDSWMFWFAVPPKMARLLIPVGSIAIDGVSLTVAQLRAKEFGISIIPHTWNVTTFKHYTPGRIVNVEFDMLGKYVEKILKLRLKRKRA